MYATCAPHFKNERPLSVVHACTAGSCSHTIKQGDTLWAIGQAKGITVEAILALNPGINPEALVVGSTINLPLSDGCDGECHHTCIVLQCVLFVFQALPVL
jgi:hypothetical protein